VLSGAAVAGERTRCKRQRQQQQQQQTSSASCCYHSDAQLTPKRLCVALQARHHDDDLIAQLQGWDSAMCRKNDLLTLY
jgi:hypothetical protein